MNSLRAEIWFWRSLVEGPVATARGECRERLGASEAACGLRGRFEEADLCGDLLGRDLGAGDRVREECGLEERDLSRDVVFFELDLMRSGLSLGDLVEAEGEWIVMSSVVLEVSKDCCKRSKSSGVAGAAAGNAVDCVVGSSVEMTENEGGSGEWGAEPSIVA